MAKPDLRPLAFMSYVRFDDQHENGRLTEFRTRLSGEVRMQTGEDFSIFQDRNDIKWGENWKGRIEDSLDEVTFLIPIITPSFFNSPACRDELEHFLARERKLKRNDLILPVYYVGSAVLDEESKRAKDKLAQEIARRQYADWRDLRFEPLTSPQAGRTLARLAEQIRDALGRAQAPAKTTPGRKPAKKRARPSTAKPATTRRSAGGRSIQTAQASESAEGGGAAQLPSVKTEPPTLIVDLLQRGDFTTVTEAIAKANAGDRILIRPGLYQESLVIDKPLEITGDGEPGEVVIQATGADAVLFKTSMGRISNLSLRQVGGQGCGVNIAQGRLELEWCDIVSQSLSGVSIHDGADPRLRHNRIHDSQQAGVLVRENGRGTLEDNDIFGNVYSGVEIRTGGNPVLRHNRIHDGYSGGVFVNENGQGTLEDNDIFGNVHAGVMISSGGYPVLRRNRIHDGKQVGVYVYEGGRGAVEDNDIFANAYSGVVIQEGGDLVLRNNRINKNGSYAVKVWKKGAGTIEDNDLRDNVKGAWAVSDDSKSKIKRSGNQE